MPRRLKIAAAQMGPGNEGVSREGIVDRRLVLLDEAAREGVHSSPARTWRSPPRWRRHGGAGPSSGAASPSMTAASSSR